MKVFSPTECEGIEGGGTCIVLFPAKLRERPCDATRYKGYLTHRLPNDWPSGKRNNCNLSIAPVRHRH
jgi:hypothetical protein